MFHHQVLVDRLTFDHVFVDKQPNDVRGRLSLVLERVEAGVELAVLLVRAERAGARLARPETPKTRRHHQHVGLAFVARNLDLDGLSLPRLDSMDCCLGKPRVEGVDEQGRLSMGPGVRFALADERGAWVRHVPPAQMGRLDDVHVHAVAPDGEWGQGIWVELKGCDVEDDDGVLLGVAAGAEGEGVGEEVDHPHDRPVNQQLEHPTSGLVQVEGQLLTVDRHPAHAEALGRMDVDRLFWVLEVVVGVPELAPWPPVSEGAVVVLTRVGVPAQLIVVQQVGLGERVQGRVHVAVRGQCLGMSVLCFAISVHPPVLPRQEESLDVAVVQPEHRVEDGLVLRHLARHFSVLVTVVVPPARVVVKLVVGALNAPVWVSP
mmetsp:Transcript_20392/g.48585  ORF Transcript_20392/g.48585 Transcript_20392/m.48585 type:complete len:376 (-) Transcript_20392:314-1441(-)